MIITKNNYKEIFYKLQEAFEEIGENAPDWMMFDFINYIFDNKDECMDEAYFEMYEEVKNIVFLNEIRNEKIDQILGE